MFDVFRTPWISVPLGIVTLGLWYENGEEIAKVVSRTAEVASKEFLRLVGMQSESSPERTLFTMVAIGGVALLLLNSGRSSGAPSDDNLPIARAIPPVVVAQPVPDCLEWLAAAVLAQVLISRQNRGLT